MQRAVPVFGPGEWFRSVRIDTLAPLPFRTGGIERNKREGSDAKGKKTREMEATVQKQNIIEHMGEVERSKDKIPTKSSGRRGGETPGLEKRREKRGGVINMRGDFAPALSEYSYSSLLLLFVWAFLLSIFFSYVSFLAQPPTLSVPHAYIYTYPTYLATKKKDAEK